MWIKLLVDKAVDCKTQTNYPSRAAWPLAVFKRETGFHIHFSNLSHPGCPTSTDKPHLKKLSSGCLWNSRGKGRQSEVLVLPFKLPLSSGLKKANENFPYPFSWPFCNSISRTKRILNESVSTLFRECHGNLQTKLYFMLTPACEDVGQASIICASPGP